MEIQQTLLESVKTDTHINYSLPYILTSFLVYFCSFFFLLGFEYLFAYHENKNHTISNINETLLKKKKKNTRKHIKYSKME